jgi:signal transduction histidine kinase
MTDCCLISLKPWHHWRVAIAAVFLASSLAVAAAAESNFLRAELAVEREEPAENPTNGLGSWIWADRFFDRQECQFWRSFEIPASNAVKKARLRMTADNEYIFLLDGRELGRGVEWRHLYEYNLTLLLSPGKHVLAVKAFNSDAAAGMIFGLHVALEDGQVLEVKSGTNWRIVPKGARGWEKRTEPAKSWPAATLMASLGERPWWANPEAVEILPIMQPIRVYFWQTGWFQVTLLSVCGVVIGFSLRLMAQLALHKKERLLLQRERARIARDIHDDVGSRMTQLVLHGEVAQSELPVDSPTRSQLDRICQDARDVLSTMDEILWAVNPRRDTLNDFSSYVCGYAEEFLKPTSIQCFFDVDSEMAAIVLDLPVRRALLMAIKETLNNAVKYSGATELLLRIKCHGSRLVVEVQDNGKGFDASLVKPGRNGLSNMAQRMNELGGGCVVTSRPGQGCRVEFTLALKPSRWRPFGRAGKPQPYPAPANETKEPQANEAAQTNDSADR